jgi:AcrR family transcriptional regulator
MAPRRKTTAENERNLFLWIIRARIDQNTILVISQCKMKRRPSHPEMQGRILDATDRLLARHGYKKMTVDDLANEVGIGKGSIYLHFRSKEDVVYSHIDRVIGRLLQRLEPIVRSRLAPADKIREMIVLRVMFRFDSVQHFPQSLSDMFRDLRPGIHRLRQNHFKQEARLFCAVLKEGQKIGAFRNGDRLTLAHALMAATNSLLPFHLSTRDLGKRRDIEKTVTLIADLLLEGLLRPR